MVEKMIGMQEKLDQKSSKISFNVLKIFSFSIQVDIFCLTYMLYLLSDREFWFNSPLQKLYQGGFHLSFS